MGTRQLFLSQFPFLQNFFEYNQIIFMNGLFIDNNFSLKPYNTSLFHIKLAKCPFTLQNYFS